MRRRRTGRRRRRARRSDADGVRRYTDRTLARRLAAELWPFRLQIGGLFGLSLVATPLTLLVPVPLAVTVDTVLGDKPLPGFLEAIVPNAVQESDAALLVMAAAMFVGVALLVQLQAMASTVLRAYTGERVMLDFRTRLFRHVQRLSLAYHDARGVSDSTYRIQYDATAIQYVATEPISTFFTAAFTLIAMLYVTARIDWQLALVAIAVAPPLLVLSWAYRRSLRSRSREVKRLESGAMSVVQEALGAARVVRAFGREGHEERRFARHFREGMWARIRYEFATSKFTLTIGMMIATGTAAVLYIGARQVQAGAITVGELVLVMSYMSQLYTPVKALSKGAGSLQKQLASAERAFSLLDEEPDVRERPDARPLTRAAGEIRFEHVWFSYGGGRHVLRDVSLRIPAGTRLGIAGATGAGKTTLVSLLTRFYDPTRGRILLDGVDLREYRLADLRAQFAIVLQEPLLFSTSIAENIAYAREGAGLDEIEDAARAANVRRLRRRPSRGLRHRGRRARHAPLRRRAPAHLARPGLPQGRADPPPRRADQLGRRGNRGGDRRGDGPPDGGPHDGDDRPPPGHPRRLRRAPRAGGRAPARRRRGGAAPDPGGLPAVGGGVAGRRSRWLRPAPRCAGCSSPRCCREPGQTAPRSPSCAAPPRRAPPPTPPAR